MGKSLTVYGKGLLGNKGWKGGECLTAAKIVMKQDAATSALESLNGSGF